MENNLDNLLNENKREYSLTEIYYILRKHYKIILSSFVIILFASIYYTLLIKPEYSSTGTIMISETHKPMNMLEMGLGKDRNYLENEIQILKSRTTSEIVIDKLLESEFRNNLYLLNTRRYQPTYYRKYLTFGLLDKYQDLTNLNDTISNQMKLKFSKKMESSINVKNPRGTDVLEISVTSLDPNEASLLVNIVIDAYKERDLKWATGEMSHVKSFLEEQLKIKLKQLNRSEVLLKEFQEKEKVFSVDGNYILVLENLISLESEYNKILSSIGINTQRKEYLNNELTQDEKNISSKINNTVNSKLITLKNELIKVENQLISTMIEYSENHEAVNVKRTKLKKLQKSIENESKKIISQEISSSNPILFRQGLMDTLISIDFVLANLESTANEYQKLVKIYENQLGKLPDKILKFTKLERERSIYSNTYSFMSSKLEEAKIGEASKLGKIRVVDKSIPKSKPIKPNKQRNIYMGMFFGIFIGLFIVIVIEYFDNTIKSIDQIERRGLAILSIIPSIGNNTKNKKNRKYSKKNINVEKLQRRLITHEDPKSPISEAYRSLRTSLLYTKTTTKTNFILVSSVGPGEGKTTTIANLAITYANLGKKTLLIDSDLRKPVIHKVFTNDKTPGLTSYLSGVSNLKQIIKSVDIPNLDIITSGVSPPNPSELLDSNTMNDLIDEIKKEDYEIVLFDSPPLIAVTDPYVLLQYVEQFILVIRPGITETGGLERTLSAINQANFNITGVVMNAMEEEHSYGAGYYNYYNYYYSDSED